MPRPSSSSRPDTSSSLCEGYSRAKSTAVAAAKGWGGDDDGGVAGAGSAGAGADVDANGRDGGGDFATEASLTHPERGDKVPADATAAACSARDEERSGEGLASAPYDGDKKEAAEGQGKGGHMLHSTSEVSPDVGFGRRGSGALSPAESPQFRRSSKLR